MNHRGVAGIRLLETHRKATEVLELAKVILHQMTPLIQSWFLRFLVPARAGWTLKRMDSRMHYEGWKFPPNY